MNNLTEKLQYQHSQSPPYVSFNTFKTLLDWLKVEGVPLRLDRSFWHDKFSGSTGSQLMASLRFLGLLDGNNPLPELENLIQAELEVQSQDSRALALLLDVNGNLCEGHGANIFLVNKGVIYTPREQFVLAGISRQVTIELATNLGFEIRETDLDIFDAYIADEIFVTSTSFCICPVSSINGLRVKSQNVPGTVTLELQDAYSKLVKMDFVKQYLDCLLNTSYAADE